MRVRVKRAHFPVGMGEVHPLLRVVPTHSSAKCMIMSALVISSGGESDPYRPFREKSSTVKVMVRFYSLLHHLQGAVFYINRRCNMKATFICF
jgi:hypothetical protein